MKKLALVSLILMYVLPTFAEEGWLEIAKSKDASYEIKNQSLDYGKNDQGEIVAVVVGRITLTTKKKASRMSQWYVSAHDCKEKKGELVTLDLKGNYQFETDFVFGEGTVSSALAEVICVAALTDVERHNKAEEVKHEISI